MPIFYRESRCRIEGSPAIGTASSAGRRPAGPAEVPSPRESIAMLTLAAPDLRLFWSAYDLLDLASGSIDVLGFQAGYIALADKLLPGFSAGTTSPRYVSMLCAAVAAADDRTKPHTCVNTRRTNGCPPRLGCGRPTPLPSPCTTRCRGSCTSPDAGADRLAGKFSIRSGISRNSRKTSPAPAIPAIRVRQITPLASRTKYAKMLYFLGSRGSSFVIDRGLVDLAIAGSVPPQTTSNPHGSPEQAGLS